MTQIYANNLVKTYGNRTVVKGISVDVSQGEIVGLLGPNGAGKTTTFYMIVGLIRPESGNVCLNNEDITHLPMYARAQHGLGYLAQENSVFRKLTAFENFMLVLEMWRGPDGRKLNLKERRDRADQLLEELGLAARRDSVAGLLSGGERRRVEIGRVLATDPKFILLDEPFTGVDPLAINDLQRIIHDLINRGIGVLITDHNVHATLTITNRAYIISDGEIKTSGSSEKLVDDPIAQQFYLGEGFRL
ncbi:MAG: LPS export ABC transporter ATP-binding protein [Capsulimonadaceae bacterium]|nr:LPS export ABC transporter ATP-binding protein [Capsulimonadaceae bacterium]